MGRISNLAMAAVIGGLAFAAYHESAKEKAEEQTFEAARQAALDAPEPFLKLDRFTSASGDYGKSCFILLRGPCERRTQVENELVVAGARKGSAPALVFFLTRA